MASVYANGNKLPHGNSSKNLVPNAATATRIAESVWLPLYGEADLQREKPFKAILHNGVRTVEGTLPKNVIGGVAIICISEKDGRLSHVNHGKPRFAVTNIRCYAKCDGVNAFAVERGR